MTTSSVSAGSSVPFGLLLVWLRLSGQRLVLLSAKWPDYEKGTNVSFFAKTEPIRRYLYGLLAPVLAVLVVYGVVDENTVPLWVALGAAVLVPTGVELARRKTTPVE